MSPMQLGKKRAIMKVSLLIQVKCLASSSKSKNDISFFYCTNQFVVEIFVEYSSLQYDDNEFIGEHTTHN